MDRRAWGGGEPEAIRWTGLIFTYTVAMPSPTRILFLCTGNSARSILAEAIANAMFGEEIIGASAGSKPKGEPHPMALKTLEDHGLPADHWRSKSWDEFRDSLFDLVVTLCDSASEESCPVFPGTPVQTHWGFPDPPAAADPEAMFEEVFDGLVEAIGAFVEDANSPVEVRAARAAELVRSRFPSGTSGGGGLIV